VNGSGPPDQTPNDLVARTAADSCSAVSGGGPPDLVVSGGGATLVDTDVLEAQLALLRRVHAEATDWKHRLELIRDLEPNRAPAWHPGDEWFSLLAASQTVEVIETTIEDLAHNLALAADAYADAERARFLFARVAGEASGWLLGAGLRLFAPFLVVSGLQAVALAGLGLAIGGLVTGTDPREVTAALGAGIVNSGLLTDAAFVASIRVVMSSLDDVAAGFAGVPFPVSGLLGEGGVGVFGVTSSAAGALAVARRFTLLQETPVMVNRQSAISWVSAPTSVEALAARIPPAGDGLPQVRIERYSDSGRALWAVYIAGTVDWNPVSTTEPWDLSSNVAAMANENAGSYEAVVQAMRAAGIAADDPVTLVGHSQGGLVAQRVAAEAEFHTDLVVTFGAPESPVRVPTGVTELAVEHTNDLVPALGGLVGLSGAVGRSGGPGAPGTAGSRVYVRRTAFGDGEIPIDTPLPAHALSAYRATARAVDAAVDPALTAVGERLAAYRGIAPGTATLWRGMRAGPVRAAG